MGFSGPTTYEYGPQAVSNQEIGKQVVASGIVTNYHEWGSGTPVLLLHGSGPGVSAYANWRLNGPFLGQSFRVIAPDIVGFGFTERPKSIRYRLSNWVHHVLDLLNVLEISRAHIIGNSFGGALALALAVRHPDRIDRLVLMGSAGIEFELTPGLDATWGYTPSLKNMQYLLDLFAYDRTLVTDDLAQLRYEASMRPGFQESYEVMFPSPRQKSINALASDEESIRCLHHDALIVHGREDRIIPPSNSSRLFDLIPNAELHMFSQCGHWIQIERANRFNRLVNDFLHRF